MLFRVGRRRRIGEAVRQHTGSCDVSELVSPAEEESVIGLIPGDGCCNWCADLRISQENGVTEITVVEVTRDYKQLSPGSRSPSSKNDAGPYIVALCSITGIEESRNDVSVSAETRVCGAGELVDVQYNDVGRNALDRRRIEKEDRRRAAVRAGVAVRIAG